MLNASGMKRLLLTLSILIGSTAWACDPTESPNCPPDFWTMSMPAFGMATSASLGLAGLITAGGGATHLREKGWRRANYIIGTLNLVQSLILGSLGAAYYQPGFPANVQTSYAFLGAGIGALAVGALDIGLAVGSAVKSSRPQPRMTVVPLASRDTGGVSIVGRF